MSASKTTFRVGTYSHITYQSAGGDYLRDDTIGGNRPPGHDARLFPISGTESFNMPSHTDTIDIPRPLITQS